MVIVCKRINGSICFQAIDGGFPQDALVDMTGALGEEVRIQELLFDDQLWKRMMKSNDKEFGPLLTAGIMGRNPDGSEAKLDTGLFGGHAYSITAVREVQKGMSRHVGGCATYINSVRDVQNGAKDCDG